MNRNKKNKTGMSRLIEIAGTKRWLLLGSMFLAIATAILQFIPFISIYKILVELADNAASPQLIDRENIWYWGFVALWSFVGFGLLTFISLMLSHIAAFNILYELRMQLAQKMVRLPTGFFSRRTSGELKKIMSDDVERIELFVAHHIPDIVSSVCFPLFLITYMFMVDWQPASILLLVLAGAFGIMWQMYGSEKVKKVSLEYVEAIGRMNSSIVEYIRGIQVVKTFSRSTEAYRRLNEDIENYRDFASRVNKQYRPTYVSFQTLLSSALLFIIPVITCKLVHSGSYSAYVPSALMFLIFAAGLLFPVLKLMWIGSFLNQNNMGVAKIDEILLMPEIDDPENPCRICRSDIEFDSVSFTYGSSPVLNKISFSAAPGSVTALVGPSGAGKTTIAMLTARFWDVNEGEIRIGGASIKQIRYAQLMDHIAFVFQDNMLFFDTIEENIRMGNRTKSFSQVVEAARAACCHDFISALPNGYRTLVGEGGTYLSGGEQQRIALARAVLKDAPVILLDEATAYADPENEGKILEAFSHLIKGKTVLVIAHRLSTITNADQILYVDKGEIAERGTHKELLSLDGRYARMWRSYCKAREWSIGGK